MSANNHYIVQKRSDGRWEGIKRGNTRASYIGDTQREAFSGTKNVAKRNGGGEVQIRRLDGTLGNKDTVPPGNDPRSTRG